MLESIDTLIAFALIFTVVSLLITIVVQIVTSVVDLRGKNLAWGVAEAFAAIAPDLKAEAGEKGKNLADYILKDPLLSDSQIGKWVGTAKAVRSEELFSLLHRIAINKRPVTGAQVKDDVKTLFKNLGVPDCVFEVTPAELTRLQGLKANITAKLAGLPAGLAKDGLQSELEKIDVWLNNTANTDEAIALRWTAQGEGEIQKIYQKFECWFEIGQERSQEWFATHARIITTGFGLIAAFWLQLDTVEIYKLVSSNREVRDNLVAQSKAVIDRGEKILKDNPTVLQTAVATMSANNSALANITVAAGDTVESVKAKIRDTGTHPGHSQAEASNLAEGFDQQVDNVFKTNLGQYAGEMSLMTNSLDKTGFDLFPKGGWRWTDRDAQGKVQNHWWSHLLGMLFSALLLSLGAPFWFNALKSLANLRSTVAKNISDEDKVEQKSGKAEDPGKAPPTVK